MLTCELSTKPIQINWEEWMKKHHVKLKSTEEIEKNGSCEKMKGFGVRKEKHIYDVQVYDR